MNNSQRKAQKLTKLGFKKGEHFRMRNGKAEWDLSSFTQEEYPLFTKYLNNAIRPICEAK